MCFASVASNPAAGANGIIRWSWPGWSAHADRPFWSGKPFILRMADPKPKVNKAPRIACSTAWADTYHHQIDGIVADALCCNQVFLRKVSEKGWWAIIRLKDERLDIWKDATGVLAFQDPVTHEVDNDTELTIWEAGMQFAALSLWKWWQSQGTRSARDRTLPLVRHIEHAWRDFTHMRKPVLWLTTPT